MITYPVWWETILKPCTSYTIIDQGLARCNHEDHHWQWCSFDKCPKVERQKENYWGERNPKLQAKVNRP